MKRPALDVVANGMRMRPADALLAICVAWASAVAHGAELGSPLYDDNPAILRIIQELKPGEGAFLPPTQAIEGGHKLETGDALPKHGPSLKDYSNKMPYIPSRQTAFHCGGGHAHQRYNDAWEYHLGSNTWIRLLASEGGDQGGTKYGWFVCRKIYENPKATLSEQEQKGLEHIRNWFKKHAVIKDGYVQTRTAGAGFMTSHTWDGLTYDPIADQAIHFSGYAKMDDYKCYFVLMEEYTPENFDEKLEAFKKNLRLAKTPMWAFDFKSYTWSKVYPKDSEIAVRNGSGAFMHYIPDLKKSICYQVHKSPYTMNYYDAANNTLEDVNPNGGESLATLVNVQKIAPTREGQAAYSPKHKLLADVVGHDTFLYDIEKNAWRKSAETRPMHAHDARTVFAYNDDTDTFVLFGNSDERKLSIWQMKLDDEKWTKVEPAGKTPDEFRGRGFYHPVHKVFVISSSASTIWIYKPR